MEHLAWCAGLFDGEGSISLHKRNFAISGRALSPRYTLSLNLTMVHKPTVEHFQTLVDLGALRRKLPGKKSRRVSWHWRVQGLAAVEVLEKLLPYLVTKRKEAAAALDFSRGDKTTSKRLGVPPEILAARESAYQEMRKLKQYEWV